MAMVACMEIDFAANQLYISSLHKTVRVWELTTSAFVLKIQTTHSPVRTMALHPTYLITAGDQNLIEIWNREDGTRHSSLIGRHKKMTSLAITPDHNHLIVGNCDNKITIWNLNTFTLLADLEGSASTLSVFAITPNSQIVIGSWDTTIEILDSKRGASITTLKGHSEGVCALAISSNGRYIASGSSDTTIKIWNVEAQQLVITLKEHSKEVSTLAFSEDSRYLVSGSWDAKIHIWELEEELFEGAPSPLSAKLTHTLADHTDGVRKVAVGDNRIFSWSSDTSMRIWDLTTGKHLTCL